MPKHGNLDSFLDLVTSILADGKPVLKLFDAQTGAELLELSQIIDGDNYVAGMSRGKFRPYPYAEILDDRARAEINKTPRPPLHVAKAVHLQSSKVEKEKCSVFAGPEIAEREKQAKRLTSATYQRETSAGIVGAKRRCERGDRQTSPYQA